MYEDGTKNTELSLDYEERFKSHWIKATSESVEYDVVIETHQWCDEVERYVREDYKVVGGILGAEYEINDFVSTNVRHYEAHIDSDMSPH